MFATNVMTSQGLNLVRAALSGAGTITFTRAVGGSGVTATQSLPALTAVQQPQQTLSITALSGSESGPVLSVRVASAGLQNAYTLRQIGIYARLDSDAEDVLFQIVQDETGVSIPAGTDSVGVTIDMQIGVVADLATASGSGAATAAGAYKVGGSVTFDNLPALTAANAGIVINVAEDFTTTGDFIEGAGKTYSAGTNVVVAVAGENAYKYDVLSGPVDLSGYVQKENGKGLSTNDFTDAYKLKLDSALTEHQSLAAYALKSELPTVPANVSAFTNDAGYLTQHQDITGKVDKETGKGLSTNDYTTAEKNKLAGIPSDATNNNGTITGIIMNGASKGTGGVVDLGTVITDVSGKLDASRVGAANGVAELDANGKVPSAQLPSYVDDALEYASLSAFPATGESGKIYVATDVNLTYRWSGSAYVEISPSIAIGETSSTAYRGDRGKAAYDHAQTVTGNPHNVTKSDVGLGNVDNTSDVNKPVSNATQTALDGKVDKVTGKGLSANDYTTAEKLKLENIEAEAQVNEVSAEQHAGALAVIIMLSQKIRTLERMIVNTIAGLNASLSMTVSVEKGYAFIEDAAAGNVSDITVNSTLAGTTLYIQIRNIAENTFQSVSATVSSTGSVPLSGLTVSYGKNAVYVATTAYVWSGSFSNAFDAEGKPVNGVDFTITYPRDKQLGIEIDKRILNLDSFMDSVSNSGG